MGKKNNTLDYLGVDMLKEFPYCSMLKLDDSDYRVSFNGKYWLEEDVLRYIAEIWLFAIEDFSKETIVSILYNLDDDIFYPMDIIKELSDKEKEAWYIAVGLSIMHEVGVCHSDMFNDKCSEIFNRFSNALIMWVLWRERAEEIDLFKGKTIQVKLSKQDKNLFAKFVNSILDKGEFYTSKCPLSITAFIEFQRFKTNFPEKDISDAKDVGTEFIELYTGGNIVCAASTVMCGVMVYICSIELSRANTAEKKLKKLKESQEAKKEKVKIETRLVDNPVHLTKISKLEEEIEALITDNARLQEKLAIKESILDTYKKYQLTDTDYEEHIEEALLEVESIDLSKFNILLICKEEFDPCYRYTTYDYHRAPKRVDMMLKYDIVAIIVPSVEHVQSRPVIEYCRKYNINYVILQQTNNDAIDLSLKYYVRHKGLA